MDIKDRSNFYVGETNKMLRNGFGVYIYENRFFKYEGEWQNGKKHGHGRLIMNDGSYYEGEFQNGEISGKGERYWSKSKNLYRGDFKNGELQGKGIMFYGNGDIYDGDWNRNLREGSGYMKYYNENEYEGEFYKHLQHGEGMMIYRNGNLYTGYWVCGKQHGHGKLTLPDASTYEGQFSYNLFNGEGTFNHISGVIFRGFWEQNLPYRVPKKIKLATDILDCFQGHTFNILLNIVDENDDIVHEESGRQLKITAGMKYQPINETNTLFELIEQMQIIPIETPLYPVLLVPLTDIPPERLTEFMNFKNQKSRSSIFENDEEIDDLKNEINEDQSVDRNEEKIICNEPIIRNSLNGLCEFSNLFIQQPDKFFLPYLLKDQNAGIFTPDIQTISFTNSSNTKQKIVDQLSSENAVDKRRRLGDEKFTRPGEYILIIEDVTENPYMSLSLETFYTTIQIHPFSFTDSSRNSKVKEWEKRKRSQCNLGQNPTDIFVDLSTEIPEIRRSSDLF